MAVVKPRSRGTALLRKNGKMISEIPCSLQLAFQLLQNVSSSPWHSFHSRAPSVPSLLFVGILSIQHPVFETETPSGCRACRVYQGTQALEFWLAKPA